MQTVRLDLRREAAEKLVIDRVEQALVERFELVRHLLLCLQVALKFERIFQSGADDLERLLLLQIQVLMAEALLGILIPADTATSTFVRDLERLVSLRKLLNRVFVLLGEVARECAGARQLDRGDLVLFILDSFKIDWRRILFFCRLRH